MPERVAKLLSKLHVLSALGILATAAILPAQSQSEIGDVEVAALRALLASGDIPGSSIAISPLFDRPGTAPGHTASGRVRPPERSTAVGRSLRARIARMEDVIRCSVDGMNCVLEGVQTVLSLSEPSLSGERASVTVTARFNTRSLRQPIAYQTIEYKLIKRYGKWTVCESSVLGVS